MMTASKEELEFLAEKGDNFMKKIKDEVNRINDENYFANFISVEEDEEKKSVIHIMPMVLKRVKLAVKDVAKNVAKNVARSVAKKML